MPVLLKAEGMKIRETAIPANKGPAPRLRIYLGSLASPLLFRVCCASIGPGREALVRSGYERFSSEIQGALEAGPLTVFLLSLKASGCFHRRNVAKLQHLRSNPPAGWAPPLLLASSKGPLPDYKKALLSTNFGQELLCVWSGCGASPEGAFRLKPKPGLINLLRI